MQVIARSARGRTPTWRDAEIHLDIGASVVPSLTAVFSDASWGYTVTLKLVFSASETRYKVFGLHVDRLKDFENVSPDVVLPAPIDEITSVVLRTVRVADMTRLAASAGIFVRLDRDDPPASLQDWYGPRGEPSYVNSTVGDWMSQWADAGHLETVAFAYQLARIASQPPAKAVERQFDCSPRTASGWIAAAKREGLLDTPQVLEPRPRNEHYDQVMSQLKELQRDPLSNRGGVDGKHPEAS